MPVKEFKAQKGLELHFIEITERIAELAAAEGVSIIPYRDPSLPLFSKLKDQRKLEVLWGLGFQKDLFELASSEGLPLRSPQMIWRILKRMKLTPPGDLFDKIEEDDTVEIYMDDGTSCFKNLTFFKFISLCLEELYTLSWKEAMALSPQMYLCLLELGYKMKMRQLKYTFAPWFSDYVVGEKIGERRSFNIHLKWISPLRQDDGRMSVLTINRTSFAEAKS